MSIEIIDVTPQQAELMTVVVGPPGKTGPAGASAIVYKQTVPAATWSISHQLDRLPMVSLYLDDEPTDAPMHVTDTAVVVTWPYPVAGTAILI